MKGNANDYNYKITNAFAEVIFIFLAKSSHFFVVIVIGTIFR